MSSNIKIQRICQNCGKEFTARTTVTKCCSNDCAKRLYKKRKRTISIEKSDKETFSFKIKPVEEIKAKEFLTVREVATLLNCSLRTTYRLINLGSLKATNLFERKTLVKRSDIEILFERETLVMRSDTKTVFEQPKPMYLRHESRQLSMETD